MGGKRYYDSKSKVGRQIMSANAAIPKPLTELTEKQRKFKEEAERINAEIEQRKKEKRNKS